MASPALWRFRSIGEGGHCKKQPKEHYIKCIFCQKKVKVDKPCAHSQKLDDETDHCLECGEVFCPTVGRVRGYSDTSHHRRCRITCRHCEAEFTTERPCDHAKRQLGTVRVVRLDHQPIDIGTQLLGDARSISSEFDAAGLERAISAEFGLEVADVTVTESVTDSSNDSSKLTVTVEIRAPVDAKDLYRGITEIGALREFKFEGSQITDGIVITCLKCNHMPFRKALDYTKHKCLDGAPTGGGRSEPVRFEIGGGSLTIEGGGGSLPIEGGGGSLPIEGGGGSLPIEGGGESLTIEGGGGIGHAFHARDPRHVASASVVVDHGRER